MKLLVRIFKPVAAWVSRSKIWKWGKSPAGRVTRKVVSGGLTLASLSSMVIPDRDRDAAEAEATLELLNECFLPDEIKQALSAQINDSAAISHAAALIGMSYVSETADGLSIIGFSFLCLSSYLLECPDGTLKSASEIRKVLVSEEFAAFVGSASSEEDLARQAQIASEEISEADFGNMPDEALRWFDFLTYVIDKGSELSLNEKGQVDPDIIDVPRSRVEQDRATAPRVKMGLQ